MSDTGIVAFDYDTWAAQFPELAPSINSVQALNYFGMATLYLDNTPASQVPTMRPDGTNPRQSILYMLTSHMAALLGTVNGQPASTLVGRISNAAEGSVNVAVELNAPMSAAWFAQTRYGLMAWQALAPYRTGRYIPPPQIPLAGQSYPLILGGFVWPR